VESDDGTNVSILRVESADGSNVSIAADMFVSIPIGMCTVDCRRVYERSSDCNFFYFVYITKIYKK